MNKKVKIIPRGNNVLVKQDKPISGVNEYGLSRPSSEEREPKSTGKVIEIGNVKDIKIGDHVVYGTFAGDDIEMNGINYKLIDEEYIIAFIK